MFEKRKPFEKVVRFIDKICIGISRPGGEEIYRKVVHIGHKILQAIKFQAVTSKCGLSMYLAGLMEGRRHEGTLYISSGLDRSLSNTLQRNGNAYYIYGDSGHCAIQWFQIDPGSTFVQHEHSQGRLSRNCSRR